MGITMDNPRREKYTIYAAARNANGDYSTPTSVSIEHPGIAKLDLSPQDVKGLISSIQIKLPTAYSKTSQTVYPFDTTSEAKNILGYKLYVMEIDPDTEEELWAEEEILNYAYRGTNVNPSIYYQAETGKKFKFRVGVYDSVYHPKYNPVLYESTISDYQIGETFKIEQPDISDALIQPNDLTEELTTTEDIEEKITLKVGNHTTGVAGGIGLRYDDGSTYPDLGEGVDVQVVANRFRVFKEDFSEDGNALFAVGTVDDKDQIYMNADEIALVSKNPDLAGGEHNDNFFVLDNDGLRIWTPGLQLSKDGSAVFDGEVNATQFSVGNWSTDVSGDNLPEAGATKNDIIIQSTEPNPDNYSEGDMWIDSTNNTPYTHNGSIWTRATWDSIHLDENAPSDNATENTTYVQSEAPAGTEGDLWIQTPDYMPYVYGDGSWSRASWSGIRNDNNAPEDNAKPNEFSTWGAEAGNGAVILNDEGLIGTDGTDVSFKIDTSGDAYFAGELYGVDGRFQVDEDGVRFYIDADLTETALELTSTGDATFAGELQAVSGSFDSDNVLLNDEGLSVNLDGNKKVDIGQNWADGEITVYNPQENAVMYLQGSGLYFGPEINMQIGGFSGTSVRLGVREDGDGFPQSWIQLNDLPTSDPGTSGVVWRDGTNLRISTG